MKNIFIGFIAGIILGTAISAAYSKYESGSLDAESIVGYGHGTSGIVAFKVDSEGKLYLK